MSTQKKLVFDKSFKKSFRTRIANNPKLTKQFDARTRLFSERKLGPPINDYPLSGDMKGCRSFSVNGDIRVVYIETDDYYLFVDIGSHNQVY